MTQAIYEVRSLRPQRWRITFAHYVFRSKPELMPALRTHFRHMSEQITDQGYIGNDAALLENLEGERVMETSRFLVQITLGKPIGGTGTAASHAACRINGQGTVSDGRRNTD